MHSSLHACTHRQVRQGFMLSTTNIWANFFPVVAAFLENM